MGGRIWKWDTYDIRKHDSWSIADVVDIGANVGGFSLMSRILFPIARIYAIEPCVETYNRLKETTEVWGVRCYNFALGNGEKMRFRGNGLSGYNRFFLASEAPNLNSYAIQSYSLSKICDMFHISERRPYIIKIDCEGGERFVLEDKKASERIRNATKVLMELHYKRTEQKNLWENYLSQFKDTHDLLLCSWYRDEFRRHYVYKSFDVFPERGCQIQLLNKKYKEAMHQHWWIN